MRQFGQGTNGQAGTFMELRVRNAKDIEAFSAFPHERERVIPHNTCFQVLGAFSAADVKILEGFGSMPPDVDLVILEEVIVFRFVVREDDALQTASRLNPSGRSCSWSLMVRDNLYFAGASGHAAVPKRSYDDNSAALAPLESLDALRSSYILPTNLFYIYCQRHKNNGRFRLSHCSAPQ